ncbi:DUF3563 family protein [Undibacterium arcticum]|uniref:DUF3563 family protein n=1 Tax=Undibacterium arcticum TaxID=1762892 RepID=A0ABV7EY63_9BURK
MFRFPFTAHSQNSVQVANATGGSKDGTVGLFATLWMFFKPLVVVKTQRPELRDITADELTEQPASSGPFVSFFKQLVKSSERREAERQEAYFAESVDIYDLEYRMRALDRKNQTKPTWLVIPPS